MKLERRVVPSRFGGSDREVWIEDQGDCWQVYCSDCGIRLGNTTNPDLEQRGYDAVRFQSKHEDIFHLD